MYDPQAIAEIKKIYTRNWSVKTALKGSKLNCMDYYLNSA